MLALFTRYSVAGMAMVCLALAPADASAQYYGYGGYGGGYGGYGYGGYNMLRLQPTGVRGSAFIRTMPSGYGGYGAAYSPALIYRSPSSFDASDDPYQPESQVSSLERSMQRFRDLRESSRRTETYYSNETYDRHHPFDQLYYNRMMTP